jgi:hypothetical protein
MSTERLFRVVCDGCGARLGLGTTAAHPRRQAKALGWLSIPGNGAARGPHRTERVDYCPRCQHA